MFTTLLQIFAKSLMLACLLRALVLHVRKLIIRRRIVRQNNCQPTPGCTSFDPFGLKELREAAKAFRNCTLIDRTRYRYAQYGTTFTSQSWLQTTIHTIEPTNIKAVLATNFDDYGIGWRRKIAFGPLLGNSLFLLDGSAWKKSRALLHTVFRNTKLSELTVVENELVAFFDALEAQRLANENVDLAPHLSLLATCIAASFIRGSQTRGPSTSSDTDSMSQELFLNAMKIAGAGCEKRWQLGILSYFTSQQAFYENVAIVHAHVDKQIDGVLEVEADANTAQSKDFLAILAEHTKDREVLRNEACMLFIAATDAIGCTLINLFFMIGREPKIWKKLRDEVKSLQGATPTTVDVERLKYHRQCVQETLRLLPALPNDSREACKDTILPLGGGSDSTMPVFVPSGSVVTFSITALHRRRDLWGEDADIFRPERWADIKSTWNFIPFLQGPRICLGHEFAMNEIVYVLARMTQSFREVRRVDDEPWIESISFGACSANGVKVMLFPD